MEKKKWETRQWWESGEWTKEEIEEMEREELERLSRLPWFESGKPCRSYIFEQRDWAEEMELTWGKWGAEGIGKLRKVSLLPPHEYETNPIFEKEPAYYRMYKNRLPNLKRWRKAFDDYVKALEGEGVEVIFWDPPESPLGPYGFLKLGSTYYTVTKAGVIIDRAATQGCRARTKWHAEQMIKMGCPILYMLHGKEVGENTPIYLGENSVVINEGLTVNREACNKVKSILEELGDEVWVAHTTGPLDIWRFPAGGCSHLDMVLCTVDLGLATVYPGFLDYETIRYLKRKNIRLIEVPPEEFIEYGCNGLILEPGKVIVPATAKETIKALRKEGVEVIDIDFSENAASGGGGPNCITGKLLRDPGPSLSDL